MPLPIIAGTVRASYQGAVGGKPWANVIHFRFAAGASTPGSIEIDALHALAQRLYAGAAFGAGAPWFANCAPPVTLTKATYLPLDGLSLPTERTLSLSGGAGAGAPMLPWNAAFVVTNRTAFRGRSRRGRTYLPAPIEAATDVSGFLTQAIIDGTLAQWTGLRTALGGHETVPVSPFWEIGVASYKLELFTPSAAFSMDGVMDHQDRRKFS